VWDGIRGDCGLGIGLGSGMDGSCAFVFCILMGGVGWDEWQNTQNIRASVVRVAIIMTSQSLIAGSPYIHFLTFPTPRY
jgi:hypothetical protein